MHRRRVVAWVIIIMSLAVFVPSITIVNATAGTPVQGSIVVDTVWDITGSPYWVVDNVTVSAGATLTIESGVEVLFDGKYDIVVFGSFLVLGERDDEILLDYNTTTSPMAKHWMIDLRPGGSLRLSHAVIKHGGIIADQSKDFVIENSEISNSSWSIHMYNVDGAQILANHIHDIDDHAISAWQGSDNGTLNNNRFDDNNGVVAHLWQAKNWRIENNTFRGGGACLFVTGSLENITLAQNEVSECGMGISATLLSDLILLNNYVHHNTNGMLANSNPMRVEGNTLCQNSNNNLEVRGGNGVVVKRNHITHGYRGILIGGFLAEFTENFIA
ncbi:MAG: right-handed parallel beta-helix repeat-containing protein, partial [Thermoplasmata archaeon]|nr:right-handed parallel beta-helix repeat-containing protein [Thermoplasmata archaeon]